MEEIETDSNLPKSFKRLVLKNCRIVLAILCAVIVCLVIFIIYREVPSAEKPLTTVSQQGEDLESSSLSEKEIEEIRKNDTGLLSLSEARDYILEYSEIFETADEVDSFIKHAVHVVCDVDGDIREGTGVIMAYPNNNSGVWHVYTNAHITGTDPKKVRMCRVSILHSADADVYDTTAVDTYEATVIYVAEGYPEIDFAELRLVEFESIPGPTLRRCSFDENLIGDKVVLIGYPNGLTITSGIIINFNLVDSLQSETIETTAKAYPGHSGGMGYNLTNDCSMGLVTWSTDDETFFGLIQSWDMFEL